MDLKNDKRQNIQLELDFFSSSAGETREAGGMRPNRFWRPRMSKAQLKRIN
jgi:hypothetical protein